MYAVEYLDLIPMLLEKVAYLPKDTSFWIDADIRGMSLKQLGREPEPGLAGAGPVSYTHLDVYKRQPQPFCTIIMFQICCYIVQF